jgi:hypothetical protein
LLDEASCRRSGFRAGGRIRLADGRTWTLPAPATPAEPNSPPFGAEYADLIEAIMDAEDGSQQRRAELALAIFLLGHNYALSPADFTRLLGFRPDSPESTEWRLAFHQFAHEHVHAFLSTAGPALDERNLLSTTSRFSRFLAWLRHRLLARFGSFGCICPFVSFVAFCFSITC